MLRQNSQALAVSGRSVQGGRPKPDVIADVTRQCRVQEAEDALRKPSMILRRRQAFLEADGAEDLAQPAGIIGDDRLAEDETFERGHAEALTDKAWNDDYVHRAISLRRTGFITGEAEAGHQALKLHFLDTTGIVRLIAGLADYEKAAVRPLRRHRNRHMNEVLQPFRLIYI
ncbi:hypothetical protein D3C71_1201080 [compost metagenome]